MLILGGVGMVPLACSCLRLGISSVSLGGAQYSEVWKNGNISVLGVGLASRTLQ